MLSGPNKIIESSTGMRDANRANSSINDWLQAGGVSFKFELSGQLHTPQLHLHPLHRPINVEKEGAGGSRSGSGGGNVILFACRGYVSLLTVVLAFYSREKKIMRSNPSCIACCTI
jgi:hypothetical protein